MAAGCPALRAVQCEFYKDILQCHTRRKLYLEAAAALWQVGVPVHPVQAVHVHSRPNNTPAH